MKACGIGCGIVILLLSIVAGIAVWQAPKIIAWFEEMVAEEEQRQLLIKNWPQPAKDAAAEAIFPAKLLGYQRESTDEAARIPELQIDVAGKHAVYKEGASRIDAYVYVITHLEYEALVNRVDKASESAGTRSKTTVDLGENYARCYLSASGLGQNHLWYSRGRLVLFRTADSEDREDVALEFFRTPAAPAAADKEKAPQDKQPAAPDEPKADDEKRPEKAAA
jgi:hypothetical protein